MTRVGDLLDLPINSAATLPESEKQVKNPTLASEGETERRMTSAALGISLGLLMLSLAVSALPKRQTYGGELQLSGGNTRYQCSDMQSHICIGHFNTENWYARFPNSRGQLRDQAINEFNHFLTLLYQDNYCSHMLYALLCFHYFPKCLSDSRPEVVAMPCREVCEEASTACLPIAYALNILQGIGIPQHLNCTNFESMHMGPGVSGSAESCNPASSGSSGSGSGDSGCSTSGQLIACPNACKYILCNMYIHLHTLFTHVLSSLFTCSYPY